MAGDSFEGTITWSLIEESLDARYRIGNTNGQGGMRMVQIGLPAADESAGEGKCGASDERPVKVVYIAGKYRAPTPWGVEQNIQAAEAVAAKVIQAGHMPLTPHKNTAHMEGLADDAFFLAGTMELLRRCDAVVMVPGWERSVGARAEVVEANHLGLPVFDPPGDSHAAIHVAVTLLCEWATCGELPPTVTPPSRPETDVEWRDRLTTDPTSDRRRLYVDKA